MVDGTGMKRCIRCDYDLRGIQSKACPECGAPTTTIRVRVTDPQQFHRARAGLKHRGLLIHAVEPGGAFGTAGILEGFPVTDGWLWVDPNHIDAVQECLDQSGVIWQMHALPIVDRSDPVCPKCSAALDVKSSEPCPQCGAEFQWIDVANEPIDFSGVQCQQCGYELTGNESGACPECGADAAASALEISPTAEVDDPWITERARGNARRIAAGVTLLFVALMISQWIFAASGVLRMFVIAVVLLTFAGIGLSMTRIGRKNSPE